MIISKILSPFRNKGIYVSLLVASCMLLKVSVFYFPFLVMVSFTCFQRCRFLILYAFSFLLVMFCHIYLIQYTFELKEESTIISEVQVGEYTTSFTIRNGIKKYKVYTSNGIDLNTGDIITFQAERNEPIHSTIPNTFDYKNYLLSKNISETLFVSDVEVIRSRFVLEKIRQNVTLYIEQSHPNTSTYIKTFILADKSDFDQELIEDINYLGVSHLFAVSGLHIGLLVMALDAAIKKSNITIESQWVIIPLLITYLVVTSFSSSILRATLMYVFLYLNKKKSLELTTLDILSVIYLILNIITPYSIYNIGLNLSFLITLTILLSTFYLKEKNNIEQLFIISIIAMAVSLPITVSFSNEVNLISIVANVILVWLMTIVVLPLGYITFIVYPIDQLYKFVILLYDGIIIKLASIQLFTFQFSFIHPVQIVVYYVLLFLVLSSKRKKVYLTGMLIFFLISFNIQLFNLIKSVSMIDVYGDSILMKDRNDQCNILIDTGTSDKYDSVVNYIKGKQIKRIDYLFITHSHEDHLGEYKDIINSFDVKDVVTWKDDYVPKINCGTIQVEILKFYEDYSNPNNQSLIMLITIDHKKYLFTGDMEEKKEVEYFSLYDFDVDILKSGHHGSSTSSSELFLKSIQAEEVLVSSYRYNTHGHPSEEVMIRYEDFNMAIYRTDQLGTIEVYYIFNKVYKKYHKP